MSHTMCHITELFSIPYDMTKLCDQIAMCIVALPLIHSCLRLYSQVSTGTLSKPLVCNQIIHTTYTAVSICHNDYISRPIIYVTLIGRIFMMNYNP